jgi:RNA polymerase sigma factor (sigma-70 family)
MNVRKQRTQRGLRDLENLFAQAYPFARRSAQVRAAALGVGHDIVRFNSEDLGQEVFLDLWSALQSYDDSRSSLRTYTETIIVSTITSHLRRERTKKRTRPTDFTSPAAKSIELSVRIERRIDLDRALKKLAAPDLRVVGLLVGGYKPGEIAHTLSISRAAVYRRLDRIRDALKARGLEKYL